MQFLIAKMLQIMQKISTYICRVLILQKQQS